MRESYVRRTNEWAVKNTSFQSTSQDGRCGNPDSIFRIHLVEFRDDLVEVTK